MIAVVLFLILVIALFPSQKQTVRENRAWRRAAFWYAWRNLR